MSERYFPIGKGAIGTCKGCFLLIFRCNFYLVISSITIKEAIEFVPGHSLQYLVKEREREVVFASDSIQLTIVDTYLITSRDTSWNEFTFLIGDYRHSEFLWDDLGRTYPLPIRNGVDDTHIQQLDDLGPHYFFYVRVYSILHLMRGLCVVLQVDFVGTNG